MRNTMVTQTDHADLVFGALGDGVRREILTILASGPLAVTPLAERFDISRPAISRHLRVLQEAGLVSRTPRGRHNVYRLEESALREAEASLRALWRGRLGALKRMVEESET